MITFTDETAGVTGDPVTGAVAPGERRETIASIAARYISPTRLVNQEQALVPRFGRDSFSRCVVVRAERIAQFGSARSHHVISRELLVISANPCFARAHKAIMRFPTTAS